ncbi:cysteine proteinase inhibitor B-like [Salvia hispanica]|uniref:cysteine proteinase inhibitor B-like n=1 Tax=Salvia hispanica TaxID=49212 RepID=UPI002009A2AA|nr:cysteine proteinase inhibitor B-like [Salvia hispanica]
MAKSRFPSPPRLLLVFVLFAISQHSHAAAVGRKVGGRMQVRNVRDNKEVQELGRYCVREYNDRHIHKANGSDKLLVFSQVVEAETQVVSGIKYYLKISAATLGGGGPHETFEAVVLVKPWLHKKDLLDFAPSTNSAAN